MVAFKKMHGLGNDFVVLDARAEPIDLPESRIRLIGDRHFGIGFDQLMVIQPPSRKTPIYSCESIIQMAVRQRPVATARAVSPIR